MAFDGTNIGVTNYGSDTVSKVNPATGSKVDYPTGDGPLAVMFDGTNIWVTNYFSDTVTKIVPG